VTQKKQTDTDKLIYLASQTDAASFSTISNNYVKLLSNGRSQKEAISELFEYYNVDLPFDDEVLIDARN
jgi:hypothetical protein